MEKLLLDINDVRVSFGLRMVLNISRFSVYENARIGLIGENGAGKTTLLKLITGEIEPDDGRVTRLCAISMAGQAGAAEDASVSGGELAAEEMREGLSGGEKTRRRIQAAMDKGAGLMLLDEPTTDLDADGIRVLTDMIRSYRGAIILVSHDRQLLDDVCTGIAELADGALAEFPGGYSAYAAERARKRQFMRDEYDDYRRERARLSNAAQAQREHAQRVVSLPSRMGISEARLHRRSATEIEEKLAKTRKAMLSRIEHLEAKERPRDDPEIKMALGASNPVRARNAIEIRDMSVRIGGRELLSMAEFALKTGSRTALIGPNGCGKTTLLNRIMGGDPRVRINPQAKIAYFGQDQLEELDLNKTALDNARGSAEESLARTVLARLNMKRDEALKRAGVLSGGERVKVALAKIMLSDANVMILDEPTNHVDVFTMEAMQEVIKEYQGTVLFVSHDRRFLTDVATRVVAFEEKKLKTYECGYGEMNKPKGDDGLEISIIEIRMAEIMRKISTGRFDATQLDKEYFELAEQRRRMIERR